MSKKPSPRSVPDPEDQKRSILEKSEALAKDHLAKREIRIRKERVRRLAGAEDPGNDDESAGRVEMGEDTIENPPIESVRTQSDPIGLKKSRLPQPKARDALPRAPRPEKKPKKRPPKKRAESATTREKKVPRLEEELGLRKNGTMDKVAMELEELTRDLRSLWRDLGASGRVAGLSAVGVMVGVFLPWLSDPAHPSQPGLFAGGILHLLMAAICLGLMVRQSPFATGVSAGITKREEAARQRRVAIWQILLGASATLLSMGAFIYFGLMNQPEKWPVKIRYGLYVTTFFAMGLSYGGFMHFHRGEK